MKYPYHIERTYYGSPLLVLPDELELVTLFLYSDVERPAKDVQEEYLAEFDRVLHGFTSYSEIGGNAFRIEIRPDFTRVIDTLEKNPATNSCLIETPELKEIIEIWCTLLEGPVQAAEVAA